MDMTDVYILLQQYRVGVLLGLIPASTEFGQKTLVIWAKKLYPVFTYVIFLSAAIFSLYLRVTLFYGRVYYTFQTIADVILWLTELVFVTMPLTSSRRNLKQWNMIWTRLKTLDKDLEQNSNTSNCQNYILYIAIVVICCVVVFLAQIIEIRTWINAGRTDIVYAYLTYRVIMIYQLFVVIFVRNVANVLKRRYDCINELLQASLAGNQVPMEKKLHNVATLYGTTYDLTRCFDSIFGWQIFLIISCTILKVVSLIDFCWDILVGDYLDDQTSSVILITSASYSIVNIGFTVIIATYCDSVEKSGKRITTNLYLFQRGMGRSFVRKELLLLAQYTQALAPKFTAAGFYDVNQPVLTALISSLTAYVIMCIQFRLTV